MVFSVSQSNNQEGIFGATLASVGAEHYNEHHYREGETKWVYCVGMLPSFVMTPKEVQDQQKCQFYAILSAIEVR